MNPNTCRVVLRPRDPFEVFDLAMRLVRVRWRPFALMALWTVAPASVVCAALCILFHGHWALLALPVLLAPVLQAPFTLLGGRMLFADEVSVREVLRDLIARVPALIGAWTALALALAAALAVTCGVAIPLAQGALLYLTEAALLERVDFSRGASRSMRLAGASAGQTAAGLLVRWGLMGWFAFAGEATGQAVVAFALQLGEPFGTATTGVVTPYLLTGMLLSQPAWAIYRLLLYVDVRTRTEGWDLQVGLWAAGQGT